MRGHDAEVGVDEGAQNGPWGLDPALLEPKKTVTDPVHKDVFLNRLEKMIVDSPAMQRLRRIRQLGTSHLVYPGAVHSRSSHALGALRAAQDLLDAVADTRNGPRPQADLLAEWGEEEFDGRLAEVTVLARLGALLHDLCHVPYGHTIEDELGILLPHDENTERFDRLWATLPEPVLSAFAKADPRLVKHLRPLILSKAKDDKTTKGAVVPDWYEYPFVADIVGNTICADLMDYLTRDHLFSGLPVALGTRFTNEFYVNRDKAHFEGRMVIRVTRDGRERPDVVTELLKYLRYRYELSERVLYHHAKLAADAMIGKMLELWHDHEWVTAATAGRRRHLLPLAAGDIADLRARLTAKTAEGIDRTVQQQMDETFTSHGDDGLLEKLAELPDHADDDRLNGVRTLAQAVLDRKLFKLGAVSPRVFAPFPVRTLSVLAGAGSAGRERPASHRKSPR